MSDPKDDKRFKLEPVEPELARTRGVYADVLRSFLDSGRTMAKVTVRDEKTGKDKEARTVVAGLKKAREACTQDFGHIRISRRDEFVILTLLGKSADSEAE